MAANLLQSHDHHHSDDDDDFIDMEITSYSSTSNYLLQTMNSNSREFEFQKMSSTSLDQKDHSTSPADELFYNGKLLPLHLPPRFQMVDKILRNSSSFYSSSANTTPYDGDDCRNKDVFFDQEFYSTPLMTTTTPTPYDSCNISPFDSCPVSRELNPEEYLAEYSSSEVNSGYLHNPKRSSSWAKKLKLMKSSGLSSKLKAPRAYLKALFGKSGCSDESSAAKVADEGTLSKASNEEQFKAGKKAPFGQIQALPVVNKQKTVEDCSGRLHRRSFSLAIKWNYSSATKSNLSSNSSSLSGSSSSSSLSSTSSSSSSGMPFLKRSTSTVISTEVENPIQGAIAHCKLSQEAIC